MASAGGRRVTRGESAPVGIRFGTAFQEGRLLRRYQRFLADVRLPDGTTVTAHCPNTGAMLGCQAPDSRVWLSHTARAGRRCPFTWELVEVEAGTLVGMHTGRTNQLAAAALQAGMLAELKDYPDIRAEVRIQAAGVRFDFMLRGPGLADYYLEVKNVTAAVTARRAGERAGVLFCAQRTDVDVVEPADRIDPAYGRALRAAAADGVDVMAVGATVTPEGIWLDRRIPVDLAA